MKLNEAFLAPVITHYSEGDKYSTFMQVKVTKEKEQKMYPLSSVIIYSSNPHPYCMLESVGEFKKNTKVRITGNASRPLLFFLNFQVIPIYS